MSTGDYYQVCLRCGAEYGYDWNTMRRTDKVGHGTAVQNRGQMNRASGWRPRARRIHQDSGAVPHLVRGPVDRGHRS